MTIKITSPTHPEINKTYTGYFNKRLELVDAVNDANYYSNKFGIPAKVYFEGKYWGILGEI